MSRVWYCANCGYEVHSRGRCHACREKLLASDLPELAEGDEENEVGYRLGGWADRDRGRLIEYLNVLSVIHRFEEDELIVAAEDEERVDDLIADLVAHPSHGEDAGTGGEPAVGDDAGEGDGAEAAADAGDEDPDSGDDPLTTEAVTLLADAARRLSADPTDMQADADVAEASAAVFMTDVFYGLNAEVWAAVGRVTRRLLVALGAEEALDEEIRTQASVLAELLRTADDGRGGLAVGTVYETPEWLPEQRAHLSVLLDARSVRHSWEGDELVVDSAHESEVEELFSSVGSDDIIRADEDFEYSDEEYDEAGETMYHAMEELFDASGRLAGDPGDEVRRAHAEDWARQVQGPPPIGMDEAHWLRVTARARALAEAIRADQDADAIAEAASSVHETLRSVV